MRPFLQRHAGVLLALGAGGDDDVVGDVPWLLALAAGLLADLDLDRVRDALERDRAERLDVALSLAAGSAARGRGRAVLVADADDPGELTAVLEEAVDGVRQERALHERPVLGVLRIPEDLRELGPVRDPHRLVDGSTWREPDERRDRGPTPSIGLFADGTSST